MTGRSLGCRLKSDLLLTAEIARHRGKLPYFQDPPQR